MRLLTVAALALVPAGTAALQGSPLVPTRSRRTSSIAPLVHTVRGGASDTAAKVPVIQRNPDNKVLRECVGETVGTAILVGVVTSTGAAALTAGELAMPPAACIAWTVASLVACMAHVCPAHFNPAISIANKVLYPSSMPWRRVWLFSASQFLGAVIGTAATLATYAPSVTAFETANKIVRGTAASARTATVGALLHTGVGVARACAAEAFGSFLLGFTVFSLMHGKNQAANKEAIKPLVIGFTVAVIICAIGPLTMCGINPARDLGARLVMFLGGWKGAALPSAGMLSSLLVYSAAPIVGVVIGGVLAHALADL